MDSKEANVYKWQQLYASASARNPNSKNSGMKANVKTLLHNDANKMPCTHYTRCDYKLVYTITRLGNITTPHTRHCAHN